MILRCLYQKCVGAARAFGNFGGLLRGTRHHLTPETVVTVLSHVRVGVETSWMPVFLLLLCAFRL